MIEYKSDLLIDETLLDRKEALSFISFLDEEKQRHILEVKRNDMNRHIYRNIPILMVAYETSMQRHLKDVTDTQRTIDYLMSKFNLKGKNIL